MGQKISPTSLRLGINKDWASRWFGGRKYQDFLKDDLKVRTFLEKKLKNMGVDKIELERGTDALNVIVHTSRPGFIIGRGGTGVEELKGQIHKVLKNKGSIRLEIQEIKNPEFSSKIMAESIVEQIEKRTPFRRILKQTLAKIIANKQVKGANIKIG